MDENNVVLYNSELFTKMVPAVQELASIINQGMGTRIGQSTVCSQKMHTFDPQQPQEVNVLQDIDVGQTCYHRQEPGIIYHLDIFHECGLVDHHLAAENVRSAVKVYNEHCSDYSITASNDGVKVDFIDIQTGTGGGRITGSLDYGKKISLRKAHSNHVHVTMALSQRHLSCVLYVIMAVENAILACNLELRRNEKVKNVKGASKGKFDLSAYADKSDSLLQGNDSSAVLSFYQKDKDGLDLGDVVDATQDLKEFSGPADHHKNNSKPASGVNSRRAAECLVQKGIIELNEDQGSLSIHGKQCRSYLEKYLPEIQAHLRKVVRSAKYPLSQPGKNKTLQSKKKGCAGRNSLHYMSTDHEFGELEISQTVTAAARKMVEQEENRFQISHEDLRYTVNPKKRKIEICLLIDASSSMEGPRIRAAKMLAKFLFLSTADRMSVIVFHKNRAWVQVPFTRDLEQLEEQIEDIKACGETPLALGLTACLQYIDKTKARNPLIILLTDGVPTLGAITNDPVSDALEVAKSIKAKKYSFTCIGLKPHLDYLKQLAAVAGGTFYAVDELENKGMC